MRKGSHLLGEREGREEKHLKNVFGGRRRRRNGVLGFRIGESWNGREVKCIAGSKQTLFSHRKEDDGNETK